MLLLLGALGVSTAFADGISITSLLSENVVVDDNLRLQRTSNGLVVGSTTSVGLGVGLAAPTRNVDLSITASNIEYFGPGDDGTLDSTSQGATFGLDQSTTFGSIGASASFDRQAVVAALCDEIAFWPSDNSVSPDYEILTAIRPGMANVPGAKLLCASSPYARRGALYEARQKHFGKENDRVLVWQAETRTMNPTVLQDFIDQAYEDDPASASAEYGAEFRRDIEAFISREAIEACVEPGRRELPPTSYTHQAFVDPSGGSQDSMTLAIGHREDDRIVIDCIRERKPPFSPDDVVRDFAQVVQSYGLSTVAGDRYAGEWPRERFAEYGIMYEASAKPKNDLYRDLLPLINAQRIELLDNDRLVAQLVGLERQTARSGRDSISHSPGGHDDVANAVAGVASLDHEPIRMFTW